MIYQSFKSWADAPISTIIETLPISEITFPKIVVCPPRNTFTNLNYDLIHNDTAREVDPSKVMSIKQMVFELIQTNYFNRLMEEFSILEVEDLHRNWYNQLTRLNAPYWKEGLLTFPIFSSASTGSVKSKDFGRVLNNNSDIIKKNLHLVIDIQHPLSIQLAESNIDISNFSFTMNVNHSVVDETSFRDVDGYDKIEVKEKLTIYNFPLTRPYTVPEMIVTRPLNISESHFYRRLMKLGNADLKMNSTPGFHISWVTTPENNFTFPFQLK